MEFGLSEEQHLLIDSLTALCAEQIPLEKLRLGLKDEALGLEIHRHLIELGITGVMIPERLGGSGLTLLDAALISEVLGRHVVPERFLGSILACIALSDKDQDDDLRAILSGEIEVGFGFSEYIGVRDSEGLKLNAKGKLSGTTIFVRSEASANRLLLATPKGDVVWVKDLSNMQCTPLVTIDKTRRFVEFSCKKQPVVQLAKASDPLINELISSARIMIGADTLGAASVMLDKAVAYSLERKQFGRLIGSFQAVKHMCAEMAAQLEPCRSLLWYAAHAHVAAKQDFHLSACHLKALLDDVGRFVARTATEVHGGMGFTDLMGLHFWFKRIGVNRQWLGGPELVRAEAAVHSGYINRPTTDVRG